MGVLMFIVDVTLEGINTLKFGTVKRLIASTGGFWAPYMVLLCFNMSFAAISGYIVAVEAPFAAGSGIPELKSYLNGIHLRGKGPGSSFGSAQNLSWEMSVLSGLSKIALQTMLAVTRLCRHGMMLVFICWAFCRGFHGPFHLMTLMSWQELLKSAAKFTDPLTAGHQ